MNFFKNKMLLRIVTRDLSKNTQFIKRISTTTAKMEKKEHLDHTANVNRIPDLLDCRISKVQDISPTVRAMTLEAQNPKKINFKAGQWVDFFIPGEAQVGGFSMWNHPQDFSDHDRIELAVKKSKWPPAYWVHNKCKVDDKVQVRFGGDFYYPPGSIVENKEPHSILLIGGGVGINPLLSIWLHARHLHSTEQGHKPSKVSLLYSAVNQEELIFRDIIDSASKESSHFKSTYFTTRTKSENCSFGRIDFEQVKKAYEEVSTNDERTLVYLCGPPNMIRDMLRSLASLDVRKQDVFYELWY